MLSREDNELLMRTNAGTPMGELMRRFWIPFMMSRELPESDGAPQRVRLLGEQLLAFRDTLGRVGLVDELCPHRRASLFYGRNEECGIRCTYHGRKFDVTGTCVDSPTTAHLGLKREMSIKAYPVREAGGVLWAYMGPAGTEGDLPPFEWLDLPESHRYMSRNVMDCNYFGAMEGEMDSTHLGFAHRRFDKERPDTDKSAIYGAYAIGDPAPPLTYERTPYGLVMSAARKADSGRRYWRINHFLIPFFTMITGPIGGPSLMRLWAPLDDEHVSVIHISYRHDQPLTQTDLEQFRSGEVGHPILIPGTLRATANRDNDYLIDRGLQKTAIYTGIVGVRAQDSALTESAGALPDRTLEHLAATDAVIVAARRVMLDAARDMARGVPPAGARSIDTYGVRPRSTLLPEGMNYKDSAAFVEELTGVKRPERTRTEVQP